MYPRGGQAQAVEATSGAEAPGGLGWGAEAPGCRIMAFMASPWQ